MVSGLIAAEEAAQALTDTHEAVARNGTRGSHQRGLEQLKTGKGLTAPAGGG